MSKKTISEAKLAANRANAKHATGPKSAEGKSRSAANAIKHGLLAENHVEGQSHEPSTLAAFTAQFAPATPLEKSLVARLASLDSRLHRITEIEAGVFEEKLARIGGIYPDLASDSSRQLGASYEWASKTLNLLSFYEARLSRDFHRTLAELRQTQELRTAQPSTRHLTEELDKRSQPRPENACNEELPASAPAADLGRHPHNSAPAPENASSKAEGPTSFAGQSGLIQSPTTQSGYLALPPSPSV